MDKQTRYSNLAKLVIGKKQQQDQAVFQLEKLLTTLYESALEAIEEIRAVTRIPDREVGMLQKTDTSFSLNWFNYTLTFVFYDRLAVPPDWVIDYLPQMGDKAEAARLVIFQSWAKRGTGFNVVQEFFIFADGQYVSSGIAGRSQGRVDDGTLTFFPLALFESLERYVTHYHLPKDKLQLDEHKQIINTPLGFRFPQRETSSQDEASDLEK